MCARVRRQFIDFVFWRRRQRRLRRKRNQGRARTPVGGPDYLTRRLLYLDGHYRVDRRRAESVVSKYTFALVYAGSLRNSRPICSTWEEVSAYYYCVSTRI